jgi:hypothetical protein
LTPLWRQCFSNLYAKKSTGFAWQNNTIPRPMIERQEINS